nr:30S ribosomal protein S20 [Maliibacterium massiliense]
MPNIKSAIKRVKVSRSENARNRSIKSSVKTAVKKYEGALAAGEANEQSLSAVTAAVDKAVAKGVMHKNTANRKKAQLARHLGKAAQN